MATYFRASVGRWRRSFVPIVDVKFQSFNKQQLQGENWMFVLRRGAHFEIARRPNRHGGTRDALCVETGKERNAKGGTNEHRTFVAGSAIVASETERRRLSSRRSRRRCVDPLSQPTCTLLLDMYFRTNKPECLFAIVCK